ncbi:hypothetical protein QKO61_gp2 [Hymenopteran orino-related virus OKIAV87]|uniref:Uncharacterized protein n=1 Tax=Hymenopteran orino-related virus OKIAV87 TaxID=2746371 RepID=A0A7D7F7X4_9MONO|nr:hypothetical protein QKO61_gp2 [Hymenopteran orino-related virus OKIAV87]QMP82160.1 hypothetical protein [Hymenopteran orino-related virus OKIAV87]
MPKSSRKRPLRPRSPNHPPQGEDYDSEDSVDSRGPRKERKLADPDAEVLFDDVDVTALFQKDDVTAKPITATEMGAATNPVPSHPFQPVPTNPSASNMEILTLLREVHKIVHQIADRQVAMEARMAANEARITKLQEARRDAFCASGPSTMTAPHTETPHTAPQTPCPRRTTKGGFKI